MKFNSMKLIFLFFISVVVLQAAEKHEVEKVVGPFVEPHDIGQMMETRQNRRNNRSYASSQPCFTCGYSSGASASASAFGSSNAFSSEYQSGVPKPVSQSSSFQFKKEQKFVNGQQVYDFKHEKETQNGNVVKDHKFEKTPEDFGFSSENIGNRYGTYNSISQSASSGVGIPSTSIQGSSSFHSSAHAASLENIDSIREEILKMQNQHQFNQNLIPNLNLENNGGSSHKSQYQTETKYVNGQPVYHFNEEKRYENGQLVHNVREEKGPNDLEYSDASKDYLTSQNTFPNNQNQYFRGINYAPSISHTQNSKTRTSSEYLEQSNTQNIKSSGSQFGSLADNQNSRYMQSANRIPEISHSYYDLNPGTSRPVTQYSPIRSSIRNMQFKNESSRYYRPAILVRPSPTPTLVKTYEQNRRSSNIKGTFNSGARRYDVSPHEDDTHRAYYTQRRTPIIPKSNQAHNRAEYNYSNSTRRWSSRTPSAVVETVTILDYVNGRFSGETQLRRFYENGKVINENSTRKSRDELSVDGIDVFGLDLSPSDLSRYGVSAPSTTHSQRHEFHQVKRFRNGQQTYEVNRKKFFRDGRLIDENKQERDETYFRQSNRGDEQQQFSRNVIIKPEAPTTDFKGQEPFSRNVASSSYKGQQQFSRNVLIKPEAPRTNLRQQQLSRSILSERETSRTSLKGQQQFSRNVLFEPETSRTNFKGQQQFSRNVVREPEASRTSFKEHQQFSRNVLIAPEASRTNFKGQQQVSRNVLNEPETSRTSFKGQQFSRNVLIEPEASSTNFKGQRQFSRNVLIGPEISSNKGQQQFSRNIIEPETSRTSVQEQQFSGNVLIEPQISRNSFKGQQQYSRNVLVPEASRTSVKGQQQHLIDDKSAHSVDRTYGSSNNAAENLRPNQSGYGAYASFSSGVDSSGNAYSTSNGFAKGGGYARSSSYAIGSGRSKASSSGQAISSGGSSAGYNAGAIGSNEGRKSAAYTLTYSDVCGNDPCFNRGTCKVQNNEAVCVCPYGFRGTYCEEAYCPFKYCRHSGTCFIENNRHKCECSENRAGYRCTTVIRARLGVSR